MPPKNKAFRPEVRIFISITSVAPRPHQADAKQGNLAFLPMYAGSNFRYYKTRACARMWGVLRLILGLARFQKDSSVADDSICGWPASASEAPGLSAGSFAKSTP